MWSNFFKSRKFKLVVGLLLISQLFNFCLDDFSTIFRWEQEEDWFEKALRQNVTCVTNRTSYGVDLKEQKLILFWTPSFSCDHYDLPNGGNSLMDDQQFDACPHRQCYFQYDRRDLDRSDAVVFHAPDMVSNSMPKMHLQNQLWTFMMMEPQVLTDVDFRPFDLIFNLSMTFRRDSDVYIPYGRVVTLKGSQGLSPLPPVDVANRTALVTWTVSNCNRAPSERNLIAQELQAYLQVDIYGKCGTFCCPPGGDQLSCYKYQALKYKFYLAFENSLCEDYITEKFYNALRVGMVPVVYGYGDYSQVAPRGSYIDVTSFATVKDLAQYLIHLDHNPEEYIKYLDWRKDYTVQLGAFANGWCQLCTFLWTSGVDIRSAPVSVQVPRQDNHLVKSKQVSTASASNHGSVTKGTFIIKSLSKWWYSHSTNKPGIGRPRSKSACIKPKELVWWDGTILSKSQKKPSSGNVMFRPIPKLVAACVLIVAFVTAMYKVVYKCSRDGMQTSCSYSLLKI